jgi:putative transposase
MGTAHKVRAYPDPEQSVMLSRTFGCVRVVWNRTLAARHARYALDKTSTPYRATDAALTAMKRDPDLTWLSEVSTAGVVTSPAAPASGGFRHSSRQCHRDGRMDIV